MKIFLTILIFISFSYAGLSDFLKKVTETPVNEDCDDKKFGECNAAYYSFAADECYKYREFNEGKFERGFEEEFDFEEVLHSCTDFVKQCKCWASSKGWTESEAPSVRTQKFQKVENAVQWLMQEKQVRLNKKKKEIARKQKEEREKARQDSIRQESINEIKVLVENGAEVSLILDKCDEYKKTYKYRTGAQECGAIQDSIEAQQTVNEITALLKKNELDECIDKCKYAKYATRFRSHENIIHDLCEKQLVNKIKKLPPKKINSVNLAEIYYEEGTYERITGYIFQNDGEMVLMEDLVWGNTIMVQYTGYIGSCMLRPNRQIPFGGYAKYLGDKVYTTAFGARQSVPNYKLLWCGN